MLVFKRNPGASLSGVYKARGGIALPSDDVSLKIPLLQKRLNQWNSSRRETKIISVKYIPYWLRVEVRLRYSLPSQSLLAGPWY